MAKLVILPWEIDAPCQVHGCYGRIGWKLVADEYADVSPMNLLGVCDECRLSLIESGTRKAPEVAPATVWFSAPAPEVAAPADTTEEPAAEATTAPSKRRRKAGD